MEKSEVLYELGLDDLVGTPFEDMLIFRSIKEGNTKYCGADEYIPTFYVIEGNLQFIVYTPEGGEFYIDLSPGDLSGVNMNLSMALGNKFDRSFEGELNAKQDSVVVELPLEKLIGLEFKNKSAVLERLLRLSVKEGLERSRYLFFKSIYSDEEFLIKVLEKRRLFNMSTKDISEILNINLRTLQRLLKNLASLGIIKKTNKSVELIDSEKLELYKIKFEK